MKKRLFPIIKKDVDKYKSLRKNNSLIYVKSYYGDGKFLIHTGGPMPAGIQIDYHGIIRMYDKIPGYEYFIGEKKILIINMGKTISYKPHIFSYEGKFEATNIVAVDWSQNAVYSHPINNKKEIFNEWGGVQVFKTSTEVLASVTEENPSGEEGVALWPNLGNRWGEYKNKGEVVGRIPKRSK